MTSLLIKAEDEIVKAKYKGLSEQDILRISKKRVFQLKSKDLLSIKDNKKIELYNQIIKIIEKKGKN